MGLGRLNPGCDDCGCVPVINCPPCQPGFCHADDSCYPSRKTITLSIRFETYSLSDPTFVGEYYGGFEGSQVNGNSSGTILVTSVSLPSRIYRLFYSFTDSDFSIILLPPSPNPLRLEYEAATFTYPATCLCSEWLTNDMVQTTFPNQSPSSNTALYYPWLDENGWLTDLGELLVLTQVERGTFTT